MEVFEAIKKRRSIRKFNQLKEITDRQIEKLLEAARWAPTAGNRQAYFFFIVRERGLKDQLVEAAMGQEEVAQAPVVLVVCADLERSSARYGTRGRELYAVQDATIATENMWLAATAMGLGAVWIGAIDEKRVAKLVGIPSHLRPIALFLVGYPAESPRPPGRRPVEEFS